MANLTIRNVPDNVHHALRMQAARHNRSMAAEVREILATAVKPEKLEIPATDAEPEKRVLVGEAMAAISRGVGFTDEEFAMFERSLLAKTYTKPFNFDD
jgi:plasmid stability protein